MTHLAIQEKLEGKTVDWMEQVSEEQYQAKPRALERDVHITVVKSPSHK